MGWGKGRGLIFILVSCLLHHKNIFCLFQVIHTSVCFFSESSFKTPAISSFIPCFFIYKFLVCWSELLQGKVLHPAIRNEANTEHISQGSTKCREECKRYLLDNQLIILYLCLANLFWNTYTILFWNPFWMDAHLEYKVCLIKSKPWCVNCVIIYFCLRKLKSCKRKIFSVVRPWRQGGMVSSQLLVLLYLIETLTLSSLHWMVYTTRLNFSLRLKMSIRLVSSGHIIMF